MLREVGHDEVDIGQLARLRDRPVEGHRAGVRVDGGGVELDVPDADPEVGRRLQAPALVEALDDRLGAKVCVGLQRGHVERVTDQHGLHEHLDARRDLVGSSRNKDHCRHGGLLEVVVTVPGICSWCESQTAISKAFRGPLTTDRKLECAGIVVDTVTLRAIGLDITPDLVGFVSVEGREAVVGEHGPPEGGGVSSCWPTAAAAEQTSWGQGRRTYGLLGELVGEVCVPGVRRSSRYRMSEKVVEADIYKWMDLRRC